MNTREKKRPIFPSYQQDDLESPFLNEELFAEEYEADGETYLNAAEAESPFVHAFEEAYSRVVEPAPYAEGFGEDELEAESESGVEEHVEDQIEAYVQGTNDMDSVANSLAVPNRWICRLDIEYEITTWNSTRKLTANGRGTGTLISPCHILTAAHNLTSYDPLGRNFLRATRIRVTAAHDGSSSPPVASVDADMSNSHVHPRWVVSRRVTSSGAANDAGEVATNRYDYALLTLTRTIGQNSVKALGGPLGYWASHGSGGVALFERLDPKLISNNAVSVSGYGYDGCVEDVRQARSKPAIPLGSSLTASGKVTLIREGRKRYIGRSMAHDVDTCGGQSGGPVWLLHDGRHYLVGIHTGEVGLTKGGRTNHAVRVTGELIRQVNDWMTRSPCPGTSSAREINENEVVGEMHTSFYDEWDREEPLDEDGFDSEKNVLQDDLLDDEAEVLADGAADPDDGEFGAVLREEEDGFQVPWQGEGGDWEAGGDDRDNDEGDEGDEGQQEWEHEEEPGGPFGVVGGDAPGPFSRNESADELLAEDESIFSRVRGAIERGASSLAFLARIQAGERDEGKLTNQVFFARHPERNGRKLQRSEKKLAAEWRQIRDTIIRPAIRAAEQASRVTVTPDPVGFEGSQAASGWILAWTNQFVNQQEKVRAAKEAIDAINAFHDGGKLRDWSEALDTLALEFLKEPSNSGGLPAVSSRFLEWIRSEGNLATQTRVAQLVWRKLDPQKSRKYQDYAMFVATALGSPASLRIIHREDSNQLARMIRGMMHWLWLRNNVVNDIALAGARAYSSEIGVGVLRFMAEPTSSNEDTYEDPAARLGELLAMLRLAAGELRGGVSMDALFGFVLKGLAMVSTVNMGAPGKAVVSLSTDLVKALVGTSKPRVSSEEQFERRLRRLFAEIYWNTVDPDRKFHRAEGDRLVFQAGSERVRELRDREREIVNVIFTAFQRGKTWRLGD